MAPLNGILRPTKALIRCDITFGCFRWTRAPVGTHPPAQPAVNALKSGPSGMAAETLRRISSYGMGLSGNPLDTAYHGTNIPHNFSGARPAFASDPTCMPSWPTQRRTRWPLLVVLTVNARERTPWCDSPPAILPGVQLLSLIILQALGSRRSMFRTLAWRWSKRRFFARELWCGLGRLVDNGR